MTGIAAGARLGIAALVIAAVVATYAEASSRVTVNPFNLFGFFTIQSNLILAGVLLATVVATIKGSRASAILEWARGAATTYIVIVGVVYATLLAPLGAAGGVPVEWANTVLHVVTPFYAIIDWLLVGDRRPLPWRRLWLVTVYPLTWLAVVLVRGATDGWVPYPFLDPSEGYGQVAVYSAVIAVTVMAVGAVAWAMSRLPGAAVRDDSEVV